MVDGCYYGLFCYFFEGVDDWECGDDVYFWGYCGGDGVDLCWWGEGVSGIVY